MTLSSPHVKLWCKIFLASLMAFIACHIYLSKTGFSTTTTFNPLLLLYLGLLALTIGSLISTIYFALKDLPTAGTKTSSEKHPTGYLLGILATIFLSGVATYLFPRTAGTGCGGHVTTSMYAEILGIAGVNILIAVLVGNHFMPAGMAKRIILYIEIILILLLAVFLWLVAGFAGSFC